MSLQAKRELLAVTAPRYRGASKKEKQSILNEFVAATGYHRKYAINLLAMRPTNSIPSPKKRNRRRLYTEEVQQALVFVWEIANRICSKRLVPFLPELIAVLERHGHLALSAELRERLLTISSATVDRLLVEVRRKEPGYQIQTGATFPLMRQVPIRTFAEWEGATPGFTEVDLVFHCGGDVSGSHLHTLTLTDVVTGWTECMALPFRDRQMVVQSIRQAEKQLPFPLLAIDTDNGREFLNEVLFDYCQDKSLIFTRSRPYEKNDQCYVEQKNGAIVRQFVGYDRFEGLEPCRILTDLYWQLRLYVNFFQPSLKLISKKRVGSQISKHYDQAQTPYQRVLIAETVPDKIKEKLKQQYRSLDPLRLLTKIRQRQDELWRYAYTEPAISTLSQKPAFIDNNGHNGIRKNNSPKPKKEDITRRKYRRSKKKRCAIQGKRWWRTRKDPFADVWPEAQRWLLKTPNLSPQELFRMIREQHPDQFSDGQLRTLQRRVRDWRIDYIAGHEEVDRVAEIPPSDG